MSQIFVKPAPLNLMFFHSIKSRLIPLLLKPVQPLLNKFYDLKIFYKLLLFWVVFSGLLIVQSYFNLSNTSQMQSLSEQLYQENFIPVVRLQALLEKFNLTRNLLYQHVNSLDDTTFDPLATKIKEYYQQIKYILTELEPLLLTEQQTKLLVEFTKGFAKLKKFDQQVIALSNDYSKEEALTRLKTDNQILFTQLKQKIDTLITLKSQFAESQYQATVAIQQANKQGMVILLVVAVLLLLFFTIFLSYLLTRPLKLAVQAADQLARGDLMTELPILSKDESGQLLTAMQTLITSLHNIVSQVIETSTQVAIVLQQLIEGSHELTKGAQVQMTASQNTQQTIATMNDSIQQVAQHTQELADNVNTSSVSIEQMAASIQIIANSTAELTAAMEKSTSHIKQVVSGIENMAHEISHINEISQTAAKKASDGSELMRENIMGINNISQSMTHIVQVVNQLNESSSKISTITDTINEITRQTNLLSLNAAIEAARAGEHGKGFAVVANEVRRLAKQVSEATQDIIELIKNIQQDIVQAIEASHDGFQKVQAGTTLVKRAEEIFETIVQTVDTMNLQITGVTQQISQQAGVANEVVGNIEQTLWMASQVDHATKEQAIGSQQIMDAVGIMNVLTEEVSNVTQAQKQKSQQVVEAAIHIEKITEQNQKIAQQLMGVTENLCQQTNRLQLSISYFEVD